MSETHAQQIERLELMAKYPHSRNLSINDKRSLEMAVGVLKKLPMTADGVVVVPSASAVWHPDHLADSPFTVDMLSVTNTMFAEEPSITRPRDLDERERICEIVSECYSTRNAAVAAKEAKHACG
ncbi:MAG: hypothetical protein AAF432_00575 [Planctomycetota bacterium]